MLLNLNAYFKKKIIGLEGAVVVFLIGMQDTYAYCRGKNSCVCTEKMFLNEVNRLHWICLCVVKYSRHRHILLNHLQEIFSLKESHDNGHKNRVLNHLSLSDFLSSGISEAYVFAENLFKVKHGVLSFKIACMAKTNTELSQSVINWYKIVKIINRSFCDEF